MRLRPVPFILVLAACGGDLATEPDAHVLLGRWGNATAEFVALQGAAEVRLPCVTVRIARSVRVTDAGTFDADGRLDDSRAQTGDLPRVRVSGTIHGEQLQVTLAAEAAVTPTRMDLVRGVMPEALDLVHCDL
jgi:hypothetical protein